MLGEGGAHPRFMHLITKAQNIVGETNSIPACAWLASVHSWVQTLGRNGQCNPERIASQRITTVRQPGSEELYVRQLQD